MNEKQKEQAINTTNGEFCGQADGRREMGL